MSRSIDVGNAAERRALDTLQGAGLRLIERNWRCRRGELDLIMRDADVLVFVEVRQRSSRLFGGALESVDSHKRRRLIAAAKGYLAAHPKLYSLPARFDVVAFDSDDEAQWIRNAFEVD